MVLMNIDSLTIQRGPYLLWVKVPPITVVLRVKFVIIFTLGSLSGVIRSRLIGIGAMIGIGRTSCQPPRSKNRKYWGSIKIGRGDH